MPEPQWTETLLKGMPPAPPYFKRMKQVNAKGATVLADKMPGQKRVDARELRDRMARVDLVVLDTDLLKCAAEKIATTRVLRTYVDGKLLFRHEKF